MNTIRIPFQALLFWVEDAYAKHLTDAPPDLTCTDRKRAWGIPSSLNAAPKPFTDIPVYTPKHGKQHSLEIRTFNDPMHPDARMVNQESLNSLFENLQPNTLLPPKTCCFCQDLFNYAHFRCQ